MSPTKTKIAKPIAIYTRVSEQGRRSNEELLSHELQRRKVAAYLKQRGLVGAREMFEDNDRSGGKMSRPALDRAVAGVLDGTYDGIAVAYLDRYARTVVEALKLIDQIQDAGGAVIALDAEFDTTTAIGKAILTVILAFNTLYRDQAVEKAKYLADVKLAEGMPLGGTAPVGYDFEVTGTDSNGKPILGWLVPNADATRVREMLESFADGTSAWRIAEALNEAGIFTRPTRVNPNGGLWRVSTTRRWLRRAEVYTGVRVYGDQRIGGAHEAIIEPGVWRRIQKRFAPVEVAGKKTRTSGSDGFALGGGLVRCGKCAHGLSRGMASGVRTLRCNERGSGHPSINLGAATNYIADVAFRHYGAFNYQLTEGGNVEAREAAEAVLRRARADLQEAEEYTGQKLSLESKQGRAVAEAQAALDALDPEDAVLRTFVFDPEWGGAEDNAVRFAAFPPPVQRKLLRALGVERVTLLAGVKGSPAERLRVDFTDGTTWNEAEHRAERDARVEAEYEEWAKAHPKLAAKAKRQAEKFFAATGSAA